MNVKDLKAHLKTHKRLDNDQRERPHKCPFTSCKSHKGFLKKEGYVKHIIRHYGQTVCTVCPLIAPNTYVSFSHCDALLEHLRRVHGAVGRGHGQKTVESVADTYLPGVDRFCCNLCSQDFQMQALHDHLRSCVMKAAMDVARAQAGQIDESPEAENDIVTMQGLEGDVINATTVAIEPAEMGEALLPQQGPVRDEMSTVNNKHQDPASAADETKASSSLMKRDISTFETATRDFTASLHEAEHKKKEERERSETALISARRHIAELEKALEEANRERRRASEELRSEAAAAEAVQARLMERAITAERQLSSLNTLVQGERQESKDVVARLEKEKYEAQGRAFDAEQCWSWLLSGDGRQWLITETIRTMSSQQLIGHINLL